MDFAFRNIILTKRIAVKLTNKNEQMVYVRKKIAHFSTSFAITLM